MRSPSRSAALIPRRCSRVCAAKTRDQVLTALPTGTEQFAETGRTHWGPVVDGLEIPDQPRTLFELGAFSRVPIDHREQPRRGLDLGQPELSCRADATSEYHDAVVSEFGGEAPAILAAYPSAAYGSPKNALSFLVNDAEYACGADRLSRLIERTGTPVYLYQFHYAPDGVVPGRAPTDWTSTSSSTRRSAFPFCRPRPITCRAVICTCSGLWRATGGSSAQQATRISTTTRCTTGRFQPAGQGGTRRLQTPVLDLPIKSDKRLREAQCQFWTLNSLRSITAAVPAHIP